MAETPQIQHQSSVPGRQRVPEALYTLSDIPAPSLVEMKSSALRHFLPSLDPSDHFPCGMKGLDKILIVKLFSIEFVATHSWISSWSGQQPAWKGWD